jgi:hypothetical protein
MTGTPTDAWKGAMEMKTKTNVKAGYIGETEKNRQ